MMATGNAGSIYSLRDMYPSTAVINIQLSIDFGYAPMKNKAQID